jgi:hypothetical protein
MLSESLSPDKPPAETKTEKPAAFSREIREIKKGSLSDPFLSIW